jgi:hypothetical protein
MKQEPAQAWLLSNPSGVPARGNPEKGCPGVRMWETTGQSSLPLIGLNQPVFISFWHCPPPGVGGNSGTALAALTTDTTDCGLVLGLNLWHPALANKPPMAKPKPKRQPRKPATRAQSRMIDQEQEECAPAGARWMPMMNLGAGGVAKRVC